MIVHSYNTPQEFLQAAGAELESREAANSLMLGVCGQILKNPERFPQPVCLKTVKADGALVFAATMTPPHKLLLSGEGDDWEESTKILAESLTGEGWDVPGVVGPNPLARAMIKNLAAACGKRYKLDQQLRLYALRKVETPLPSRGRLRNAGAADAALIFPWWYEARVEMFGKADPEETRRTAGYRLEDGEIYVWEDDKPVSMAITTRPTKRGICVGMVFTPPDQRNRGYATACVGELSRKLLREGREFCSLYADLLNPVSNSIYQKIGYRPICDFEEYGFIEEA
jgi:predicted GNAT family acetyltransferase